MNYGFIIDNRKCIGCHACTVACKAEHETPIGVNRTWVKYVEKGEYPDSRRVFTVHRCNHCADAPCVEICPTTSLHTRSDGIVDFDRARCIGCKACMQACPYDALHIDPETHTSGKCNYCAHRVDHGIEPACVVVCPVHAIISGDMDDPGTEISRTLARNQVSVRKPEKRTRPKLYYIDADEAALTPSYAAPGALGVQTEQTGGVGHFAGTGADHADEGRDSALLARVLPHAMPVVTPAGERSSDTEGGEAAGHRPRRARRTYDTPQRGVLWDWEVTGYLWTKSISAGVLFVPLLLDLLGLMQLPWRLEIGMSVLSLLFLGATGVLLIKDLDKPSRFLWVLLRPQWRSWLVRGAYIITAFGGLTTLWLLLLLVGGSGAAWLRGLLVIAGVLTAVYTAFLFAQAKGRDAWQSPLLPVQMVLNSVITGSALLLLLGLVADQGVLAMPQLVLLGALVLRVLTELAEFVTPTVTRDAAAAHGLMLHGPLRLPFWSALLLGNLLPLWLLWGATNGLAVLPACVLVLLFALVAEHVRVRAPQLIPLA